MSVVYPQSTEDTDIPYFQAETLSDSSDEQIGVEEDEDEDLDFNPLLKGALSPEASSSLSSENEGLDALDINAAHKETDLLSNPPMDLGNVGEEEEIVVQESEESIQRSKKRKEKESDQPIQPELKEIGTSGVEDVDKEVTNCDNIVDLDEEDAICRRTRARYSLADFTLDELESFLQETDAEDGVQNIDDEHEYRKFLAAVLQGESEGPVQETGNVDDEDEENDKDFEIELEEALDSDRDEIVRREVQKEGGARRPETRRKRQRKAPTQKEKSLGQANRPLRPLLPLAPYPPPPPPPPPSPGLDCQKIMLGSAYQYPSYSTQSGVTNPFTPHQIGQLHCLIHEHAQLLVQVFSLSVLDHSRKEVAGTVQRLMTELVQTRDEALSRRKVPYPDFVFQPPYVHPSVNDCSVDPSIAPGLQKDAPDTTPALRNYNSSEGRDKEHDQGDQGVNAENSAWVPSLNGPVLSILDAAPLSLVTSYIGDVSKAAREYKQRHLASSSASPVEKEPLFPHSSPPSSAEASSESLTGAASQDPTTVIMSPSGHQQPKKSMAAMLIENTKDSVAVAPKKIVNLAQRFFPLFNSTLFPHKPPPAALVNRVLFTDAEDELLAMGLMEYNTDWKAIQQRFLPCKSKHQIFVRQKNRCSSKAPENPIKAVRRMKTSPLTTDEKARIHEGLRLLKLDWMSVWKFIVPYRDPSLLPRQWRIALGTQKSYKTDAAKREKRRLYETRRRKCKAATFANWQSSPDKEDYLVNNTAEGNRSGDDNQDEEDDAYVHEAFLSDWRPGNSRLDNSENPLSSVVPQVNNTQVQTCNRYAQPQPTENGHTHEFLSSNFSQHFQSASQFTHVRYNASYSIISNQSNPDSLAKLSKNQVNLLPRQVRRRNDTRLVKLAPELPPVNLPPSVRVISQSAFKSYHGVNPHSTEISGSGAEAEIAVPRAAHLPKSGTSNSGYCNAKNNTQTYHRPQGSTLQPDQIVSEDKGSESDLQMHPLLFGTPEDGNSRYCTVDVGPSASGTVNFLPGNQLQASFCHFSKPHEASSAGDRFYTSRSSNENPSSTHTIDFHPLLQRTDDLYNEPVTVSDRHVSVNVESFGGRFSRLQNLSSPSLTEPYDSGSQFFAPDLNVPYEKTNELDLEIHLSSTSRKEKIVSGKKVTEPNYDGPRIGLLNSGVMKENQKDPVNNPDCLLFPIVANASKQGHGLSDRALVPSSTISRFTEDVLVEPSLPEIVMEHEELSDSEEEIGEHVEFECEEMADSEGEESESEQRVDVQGGRNAMVVDEVARNKKQVVQAATKGRTRSRRLELMARGKDLPEISLQLSLDSSASQLKSKKKVVNGNDQAGNSNSSRPNRSCKRRMPILKAVTTQTNPVDVLPQLQLGSTINPTRNLRKRVYRNDSSLPSRNLEFVSSSNLVSCSLSDACGVNNTSKNVVVMDLLSSKDVAAKEITSFRS